MGKGAFGRRHLRNSWRPGYVDRWVSCTGKPANVDNGGLAAAAALLGSKLRKEQQKGHEIYTGSGHHCGVIPYSSLWCGGLPQGMMMHHTRSGDNNHVL